MIRGALVVGLAIVCSAVAQPSRVATLVTSSRVTLFVVTNTGSFAGAACEDGKLLLWKLPEGKLLQTIDLRGQSIEAVAISPDGSLIAAADHGGGYSVWATSTGVRQMHMQMPFYPFVLAFSPDGKRLAIAPAGEPVQLYDLASGERLFELQRPTGGTAAVVFSPNGDRIATADADTVVRIYDARNGELLVRNTDLLLIPMTAAFTVDGKQLFVGGGDKTILLLDAATGITIRKSAKVADPVAYMEVSPNGSFVASLLMHANNMLMSAPLLIFETPSGRKVQEWLPSNRAVGGGWTKQGLLVATATDKAVDIWRVR